MIMPVVYEDKGVLLTEHVVPNTCKDGAQETRCPSNRALSLFADNGLTPLLHSYLPIIIRGKTQPNFCTSFSLLYDLVGSKCCAVHLIGEECGTRRCTFMYDSNTSSKYIYYYGIDICVCKYMGRILVMAENSIVDLESELVQRVMKCMKLDNICHMFEQSIQSSKHVLHFTFCPCHIEKRTHHPVATVGDYLVYKFFTFSRCFLDNRSGLYAGRLNLEYLMTMDHEVKELGGEGSTLIGPSHICNHRAKDLWSRGCGILIVNRDSPVFSVVVRRQLDSESE